MKSHFFHLIVVLITAGIVLAGYGFWYAVITVKSAVVADLQEQIAVKTETANHISSARAAIVEISGDEVVVQSYFIPEAGVVAFINGLEAQGQTLHAAVDVLSVSTGFRGAQPILTFSLAIEGTFDAVMRTVGTIEYMPYDLSVSDLSLMQDDKNSWNAHLNLRVGSVKVATSTP